MAHFRTRDRVQIIKLECEIWIVTEFDRSGKPKKCEPISAVGDGPWALVALGSGDEQEVKWMTWDEAMRRYEPEDEIGLHTDESTHAAARRNGASPYADPRRDGWREPHPYDSPYGAPPPPYVMPRPTLLPPVAVPSDDEQMKRAERV